MIVDKVQQYLKTYYNQDIKIISTYNGNRSQQYYFINFQKYNPFLERLGTLIIKETEIYLIDFVTNSTCTELTNIYNPTYDDWFNYQLCTNIPDFNLVKKIQLEVNKENIQFDYAFIIY